MRRARQRAYERETRREQRLTGRAKAALGVGTAFGATVVFAAPADAATFTVTNLNDSGAGSLRQAIVDANTAGGPDVVVFQSGLSGTIAILDDIEIEDSVDIQGPGADVISLSGGGTDDILDIETPAAAGETISVSGLTLRDGDEGSGGAINTDGGGDRVTLNIANAVFTGNTAGDYGGAIEALYTNLTVSNSTFTNNSAGTTGTEGGGAIFSDEGTVTVTGSTFAENEAYGYAGAIYVVDTEGGSGNEVVIQDSSFTGNSTYSDSTGDGGAAYFTSLDADTLIERTTFAGNSANGDGGAFVISTSDPGDDLIVRETTISGNTADPDASNYGAGGGIWLLGMYGTTDIVNSTISGNTANVGGGIRALMEVDDVDLRVTNSTIAGNTATAAGGPAPFYGGGGISLYNDDTSDSDSDVLLSSSIVADNTAPFGPDIHESDDPPGSLQGTFVTGFSLIENTAGATIAENPAGSNLLGVDPLLGPLADNGGPTQTQLPALGSPVLDAGVANGLASDQRGTQRTFDASNIANGAGSDATDMGAVEQVAAGTCKGKAATVLFAPGGPITGSEGADVIVGTDAAEQINSLGANDTVCAAGGNDKVNSGAGKDAVRGEAGKDKLSGKGGKDKLSGQAGKDRLKGGAGKDKLSGNAGKDTLKGQGGKDTLKGGGGKDKLVGGPGKDKLKGGGGKDTERQ